VKTIKVGDVFKILLSDGRKAYGQYVFKDKMGPMVQIFDLVSQREIEVQQLADANLMFPPIITGLFAAVKAGIWKIVGHLPVKDFKYPNFISAMYYGQRNQVGTWYLWNGDESIPIGRKLPEEYKRLEQLVVWDPSDVAYRIETGTNPLDHRLDL
jgi:hypothetical protein